MKTLVEFINEARTSNPYKYQAPCTLYFENTQALALYEWEFSGQISDGKYENTRPLWHWEWMRKANLKIDSNKVGYTGIYHRVKYNFKEWVNYAFSTKKNELWGHRVLAYMAASAGYSENDLTNPNIGYDRSLIDDAFGKIEQNNKLTYNEYVSSIDVDYYKKCLDNAVKFDENVFELLKKGLKFIKQDVEEAIKSVQNTINTPVDE